MIEDNVIVLYSGGIGSWGAAKRLVDDGARPVLLFTDTMIEDEDLYRFIHESAAALGLKVTTIADGRTPWELFNDEGMIGNTRADICSRVLKRDLARKWIDDRYPDGTTVAVGMDWTEIHRYDRAAPRWEPHNLIAPLVDKPLLSKLDLIDMVRECGVEPPRLYAMGFPHNNCGGFCVKAGIGNFRHLLRVMPERYAEHEAQEEAFRERTGKDVSIMRSRIGGETTPLTMRQLREQGDDQEELEGFGGCGCMV